MNPFSQLMQPVVLRGLAEPAPTSIYARNRASNPWELTRAECAVMTALIDIGSSKGVATDLGLSPRTVMLHTTSVRKKMQAATLTLAVLTWDRHFRDSE